jgi:RimJ/RimL family protein N-acetyltransferase
LEEVQIKTPRLLLRPFRSQDIDDIFRQGTHPQSNSFDRVVEQPFTNENADDFVTNAVLSGRATHPHFAVVKENRVIGEVRLRVESQHETAEYSNFLGADYWGLGLAAEAGEAVIDWGFGELGLEKVYAVSDVNNTQRIQLREGVGMEFEATMRSHRIFLGERVDMAIFAVLRSEWIAKAGGQGTY